MLTPPREPWMLLTRLRRWTRLLDLPQQQPGLRQRIHVLREHPGKSRYAEVGNPGRSPEVPMIDVGTGVKIAADAKRNSYHYHGLE